MRLGVTLAGLGCAMMLAACDSSVDDITPPHSADPEASISGTAVKLPHATLTDPTLQPPVQDNKYTESSGRPKVVFDPCTWITDADIESVGFRPASRKRGTDLVAEYTFLTCNFRTADSKLSLGVDSGNITWDEHLKKDGNWLTAIEVNGRRAGYGKGQDNRPGDCRVHVETKVGVVFVRTISFDAGIDPCSSIMEIASVVEKSIGRDN